MVIANFTQDEKTKYVEGLDQYDYGQVLRIQGLNLPTAVEIHFGLDETGGTTVTRIGTTKNGVTDVIIPDSMLENNDTDMNYSIYVFVYLTNETSGQTEYRIALKVKARPRPEAFDRPEDAELFREAIKVVNESAARSAESEKQAEGWAHGREDSPERAQDNAKYYSDKAREESVKTDADRKEVERLVESVSGIGEQVAKVEGLTKQAQTSATNAALSEQATKESQNNAAQSRAGAEVAENNAQLAAQKAEQDKAIVEQAKNLVKQMGQEVLDNKKLVDETAQGFDLKAQQALADVNNAGQVQTERVQTAGNDAVESIKTAQGTATRAVETAKTEAIEAVQTEGTTQAGNVSAEGEKQVQAVQGAAQEIMADREQIQENKTGIAKLKEDIGNKAPAIIKKASGKTIIINDSSNLPIKTLSGTGKIIITGKNILKTEKRNEFIPFEAKAGTLFTIITNGEFSEGGNVKFIDENGENIWFAIDKGQTKKSLTIRKNIKGYVNLLSPKEGLKYCLSAGENDEYEEYVEQVITAPVDSEQLKAIHTNYPTTVLTSENEISVEYVADTEAYIGKRIKEENQSLQKQILEIQNALISQKISGGGIIQVKDSAKLPIQNLRVFGKSEQNGVPSLDAPIPIVNVGEKGNVDIKINTGNLFDINTVKKYEVDNTTLSLSVSGNKIIFNSKISTGKEAIVNIINKPDDMLRLLPGKYTLSYNSNKPFGATNGTDTVEMFVCIHNNSSTRFHSTGNKNWTQFEIKEGDRIYLRFDINKSGQSAEFYDIMLNHGESVLPYESYFNQSLTLSTPNGLPGIKVDSGGNYTDSTGQQWVTDEIDLERGKYIQRVKKLKPLKQVVFNKRDENGRCSVFDIGIFREIFKGGSIPAISSIAKWSAWGNKEDNTFALAADGIYYKDSAKTLEEVNALFEKIGTNFEVCGVLETSVEHDLALETISSFKSLHTNYPTTSVSNNGDAEMELTYIADTKSYIDQKIEPVIKSIVNTQIALL